MHTPPTPDELASQLVQDLSVQELTAWESLSEADESCKALTSSLFLSG
jgi:hypothetical protein